MENVKKLKNLIVKITKNMVLKELIYKMDF